MFRFERKAAVKHVADSPRPCNFAAKSLRTFNSASSLNMKVGVELFSTGSIHWYYTWRSSRQVVAIERDVAAGPRVHRDGQQSRGL